MNEEEILKIMEELKQNVRYKTIIPNEKRNEWKREYDALQRIIDLYHRQQKEIERLKEFEKYYEYEKVVWQRKDYISKDKIRELKEKYRDDYMTININNRSAGKTFKQAVYYEVRKVIDELLGE